MDNNEEENRPKSILSDVFDKILKAIAEAPPINHEEEIASLTDEINDLRRQYKSGDITEQDLSDSHYPLKKELGMRRHSVWIRKYFEKEGTKCTLNMWREVFAGQMAPRRSLLVKTRKESQFYD